MNYRCNMSKLFILEAVFLFFWKNAWVYRSLRLEHFQVLSKLFQQISFLLPFEVIKIITNHSKKYVTRIIRNSKTLIGNKYFLLFWYIWRINKIWQRNFIDIWLKKCVTNLTHPKYNSKSCINMDSKCMAGSKEQIIGVEGGNEPFKGRCQFSHTDLFFFFFCYCYCSFQL